jgi:PhnB protein
MWCESCVGAVVMVGAVYQDDHRSSISNINMMRYSVTATLDTKETFSEYCEWLNNEHIPAVISGGALTSELSIVDNENDYQVNTLYTFLNSEMMSHYLTEIAPNLTSLQTCVTKFYETKKVLNFKRFVGATGFKYQSANAQNPLTIQPGMIRYNVIATLASSDFLDEYLSWLAEGHIEAVVNAGGLSGEYNVLKNDDPNESNIQVASVYLFPNLEALHGYQNGLAITLRQDGIKRFVETNKVVNFDRYIGTIVNVTNTEKTKTLLYPMDISPYLMFDGQCREAMNFYHQCLQGDLRLMVCDLSSLLACLFPSPSQDLDSSLPNSPVLHSTLLTNRTFTPPTPYASTLMGSDNIGGANGSSDCATHSVGNAINLSINFYSYQQIQSISSSLAQNGKVSIPLSKQMWGAYFADLTDQYSVSWYLNMMIPAECELFSLCFTSHSAQIPQEQMRPPSN